MSTEGGTPSGPFGFTWGQTEGVLWLRNSEGHFKRIHPELFNTLRAIADGRCELEELEGDEREAVTKLREEGFLAIDRAIKEVKPSDEIRLWPRIGAFLIAFVTLGAITRDYARVVS